MTKNWKKYHWMSVNWLKCVILLSFWYYYISVTFFDTIACRFYLGSLEIDENLHDCEYLFVRYISYLATVSITNLTLFQGRSVVFKALNIDALKVNMKPKQRTDRWWIVVDTKVLLDDMKFIDRLVKTGAYLL